MRAFRRQTTSFVDALSLSMKSLRVLLAITWCLLPILSAAQLKADATLADQARSDKSLARKLYELNGQQLVWYCDSCDGKRNALLGYLSNADTFGLNKTRYSSLSSPLPSSSTVQERYNADYRLSDVALAFCSDLYHGADMQHWLSYDGISAKYAEEDKAFLLQGIVAAKDSAGLSAFINSLEPATPAYRALKNALQRESAQTESLAGRQLRSSLNYYRWLHHFSLDSFIVVNIPSATLTYYRRDTAALFMRTVVGTPYNRTPRFAAYCKEVTLYPYWNMPRSILVNEWLSSFKKNPGLIDFLNMEVIDGKGRIIPTKAINWKAVSASNFPYRIRQKTGCLNPMGVVKFTLTSPYDVYLHDTNFKGAFLSSNRYYSHGCIRVEEPIALADAVLVNRVDADFLKACFKDQQPQVIPLENPVPVFVVYMCAEAQPDGTIQHHKDIYGLLK